MSIEIENIPFYKYLGLSILIIISVLLIRKFYTIKFTMFEGLENQQPTATNNIVIKPTYTMSDSLKKQVELFTNQNNMFKDLFSIEKYKTEHENLLIALEEKMNIMLYGNILEIADGFERGKDIDKKIQYANDLKTFIDTLNTSMKYLNRQK
jgi:hypothetical protein